MYYNWFYYWPLNINEYVTCQNETFEGWIYLNNLNTQHDFRAVNSSSSAFSTVLTFPVVTVMKTNKRKIQSSRQRIKFVPISSRVDKPGRQSVWRPLVLYRHRNQGYCLHKKLLSHRREEEDISILTSPTGKKQYSDLAAEWRVA